MLCDSPGTLTALQLHRAGLDVHGEVLEVHRAGQNQGQPGRDRKKEVTSAYWGSTQHRGPSSYPSAFIWLHPLDPTLRAAPQVHLMLYSTFPFLKMRSNLLSVVTSWKLAPFSLAKNRSGFQIESSMEGSRSNESSGYSR